MSTRHSLLKAALCGIGLSACTSLPAPAPGPIVTPPICYLDPIFTQLGTPTNPLSDPLLILTQQIMSNHADLSRIQTQLEALQETAPARQALVKLLVNQVIERKRLNTLLDKQTIASKEQQKRANDLAAKLDALKEMEKDMLERSKKP